MPAKQKQDTSKLDTLTFEANRVSIDLLLEILKQQLSSLDISDKDINRLFSDIAVLTALLRSCNINQLDYSFEHETVIRLLKNNSLRIEAKQYV